MTTFNQVISELHKYKQEAFSEHNDGWNQNHYRKWLLEVKAFIDTCGEIKLHGEKNGK